MLFKINDDDMKHVETDGEKMNLYLVKEEHRRQVEEVATLFALQNVHGN